MKILLVEDLDLFATYVSSVLLRGEEVRHVRSAAEAIAVFDEEESFDLFLVDYDLDGDKGTDFVEWLRNELGDARPVIAISARAVGNERLKKAGANAHCAKLEITRIRAVISSVIDEN